MFTSSIRTISIFCFPAAVSFWFGKFELLFGSVFSEENIALLTGNPDDQIASLAKLKRVVKFLRNSNAQKCVFKLYFV